MVSLLQTDGDVLFCITSHLGVKDLFSLSSACRQMRGTLRACLFATCFWTKGVDPPRGIWSIIRHLHINTDLQLVTDHGFFRDLSGLVSLHICGETLSPSLEYILFHASQLQTLDLARLCWKMPLGPDCHGSVLCHYYPLPAFGVVTCKPRTLKFCSRLDPTYMLSGRIMYASKIRATRLSFASLLVGIGVAHIEYLEIGVEALSLPFIAPYTWSSLRQLILTGYWIPTGHRHGVLEDPQLDMPAWIFENVHLGTLLCAAPRLQVLRVRCRYASWWTYPCCVVWPPDDPPPSSGTAVAALQVFELCNPTATDGIYAQLPSTLHSLALLTHPHAMYELPVPEAEALESIDLSYSNGHAALTPPDLIHVLSATRLPDLRALRFSLRGLTDARLFEFIANAFPRLELLEFHSEAPPNWLWSVHDLEACAQAFAPLVHLRELHINTFIRVYSDSQSEQMSRQLAEDFETLERKRGIVRRKRVVTALFGTDNASPGISARRFPQLREVWLPDVLHFGSSYATMRMRRIWRMYHVERGCDGQADLRLDTGPYIDIVDKEG